MSFVFKSGARQLINQRYKNVPFEIYYSNDVSINHTRDLVQSAFFSPFGKMLKDILDRLIVSSPECYGNFGGSHVVLCDASQVLASNSSTVLAMLSIAAMAPILNTKNPFDAYIKEGKIIELG